MKKIENDNLSQISGGSFWTGLACGASIGAAILDPTKLMVVVAVAACGSAAFD